MDTFDYSIVEEAAKQCYIKALCDGYVISEELEGNYGKACREVLINLGDVGYEIAGIFGLVIACHRKSVEICASGLALDHVADGLFVEVRLCECSDN